jgi:hypothetical protein
VLNEALKLVSDIVENRPLVKIEEFQRLRAETAAMRAECDAAIAQVDRIIETANTRLAQLADLEQREAELKAREQEFEHTRAERHPAAATARRSLCGDLRLLQRLLPIAHKLEYDFVFNDRG